MKTLITFLICWALPLSSEEISLEGGGEVIHYKYPDNFHESNRYIRKGIATKSGDCKFNNTMRLKSGQRIFIKEIAYNAYRCESLIIEGLYTVEPKKSTKAQEFMRISTNAYRF